VSDFGVLSIAIEFVAPGTPLELQTFPIPELKSREALVRVRCATICGRDLHSYYGRSPSPAPCVLGHEMIGKVVSLGPRGSPDFQGHSLKVRDRVTWSMVWSCRRCFYCRRGLPQECARLAANSSRTCTALRPPAKAARNKSLEQSQVDRISHGFVPCHAGMEMIPRFEFCLQMIR
jgi:Zn-dependent alcohol dehydrogenase